MRFSVPLAGSEPGRGWCEDRAGWGDWGGARGARQAAGEQPGCRPRQRRQQQQPAARQHHGASQQQPAAASAIGTSPVPGPGRAAHRRPGTAPWPGAGRGRRRGRPPRGWRAPAAPRRPPASRSGPAEWAGGRQGGAARGAALGCPTVQRATVCRRLARQASAKPAAAATALGRWRSAAPQQQHCSKSQPSSPQPGGGPTSVVLPKSETME